MHKRSTRIEDILDNCVTAVHEHRETVESCLAHYPDLRRELEPLLNLAVRLQSARTLQAPAEFRRLSVIRVNNLLVAQPNQTERPITLPGLLDRAKREWRDLFGVGRKLTVTLAVSVILAVSLLVSRGMVRASADDLPGDALYSVKRAVEEVRLAISLDDANDAELHIAFAARRLDEAAALLEEGRPQAVDQTLTDYDKRLESIAAYLDDDSDLSPGEQLTLANQLLAIQTDHEKRFAVLIDQVPQAARPAVELSLVASRAMRDQALRVLGEDLRAPALPQEPAGEPRTATPLPSQKLPSGGPSRTPTPTQLFTPSPWPKSSATPTSGPMELPYRTASPSPSTTPTVPLSLEPTEWLTPMSSPHPTTPRVTPASRPPTPTPTPGFPSPDQKPPPPPDWTPPPRPTLPPDLAPSPWPMQRPTRTPPPSDPTPSGRPTLPPVWTPPPPDSTPSGRPTPSR